MIYNLAQFLMTEFPAETIYANSRFHPAGQDYINDRCLLARETGGPETPWFQYVEKSIQIISRDCNTPEARELAWDVYDKIQSRFGLVLPQVVVNTRTYAQIQTAQISSIQQPYCLGDDGEGRIEFTVNFKIIYRRN